MKALYLLSTTLFWLAVAAFWALGTWLPAATGTQAMAADKTYSLQELAGHASAKDCWMAINNNVYDFSAYLPQHPSEPSVIEPWCGKEATQAFATKMRGRPHSPYATELLLRYRIGVLRSASR